MRKDVVIMVQEVIRKQWDHLALTDFYGEEMQYKDVARRIAKMHILFERMGLQPGDKIAVCGKNSAQWVVSFLAAVTYGAVVVPILHEFKPDNMHHLVTHSDTRLFFVDDSIFENLDPSEMPVLEGAVSLKDFRLLMCRNEKLADARARLNELFGQKYPERFTKDDVTYYEVTDPNALMLINYTSGSTGFSKGVMVPYRAVWSNIAAMHELLDVLPKPGENMICMLPMAHMYGLVIETIYGFTKGLHLYFLTRQPSPKVLVDAFRTVQPRLIITVPLIIEKIIKTKVFPSLEKPMTRMMLKTPYLDKMVLDKVRAALMETFGGKLEMMIVGGAALNKEVEEFLLRINFPITVGYGMTECAPLIAFSFAEGFKPEENRVFVPSSCGAVVPRMVAKIDSPDPENVPGEILVKGENCMLGYYKNPEATAQAFRPDGWMKTGDLGTLDSHNNLFIRGRNKTMILGPSGQNIYPEEIEQKLNNMPLVGESLVIDAGEGKLQALIYPDPDEVKKGQFTPEQIRTILQQDIDEINSKLEAYSKIRSLRVMDEEFEKTPKRSIKRFLYG